jgi:hypothetical protein
MPFWVKTPTPWRKRRQAENERVSASVRARVVLCSGKEAGQEKEKRRMKEKLNYAELEKKIDFAALAGRLDKLTDKDNQQRTTLVASRLRTLLKMKQSSPTSD